MFPTNIWVPMTLRVTAGDQGEESRPSTCCPELPDGSSDQGSDQASRGAFLCTWRSPHQPGAGTCRVARLGRREHS